MGKEILMFGDLILKSKKKKSRYKSPIFEKDVDS